MGRIEPKLPPQFYTTYQIRAPRETHWRPATCAEAGCRAYLHGWETAVDEATDLGQRQAHYIRHDRTRKATEDRRGALTVFTFEAGQPCFNQPPTGEGHLVRVERPEIFIERGGDFRANPRGDRRVHHSPDDWVDSFANHQDRLHQAYEGS